MVAFFFIAQRHLLLLVIIRADERVAALDVLAQVGQSAFLEHAQDRLEALLRFAFQHFEQEGNLGRLHRLRVKVHAVDVVQQDAFAFGDGEPPAAGSLHEHGPAAFGPSGWIVVRVEVQMPFKQEFVCTQEK